MTNQFPKLILPFCISALLLVSCKQSKTDVAHESEIAEASYDEEITVKAQYTTKGILINTPVNITHQLTYKNGDVIQEVSTSQSGGLSMVVTQDFDEKQRLVKLVSEQNGERSVLQTNTYTDDDFLLTELRVEKAESSYDTIRNEYTYPNDRPNPMKYFRTYNGKKVTEMTLTKSGNTEILEESAYGHKDYIGITTKTSIKNDKGQVLELQEVSISSEWGDKTKLDTTVYQPTYYKYDNNGRLIREESQNLISVKWHCRKFLH